MSGVWPLPFEDELVEVSEVFGLAESNGRAVPHSFDHGTAPLAPILAPASAGAYSDAMNECIHLLPPSQCTLCKKIPDGFREESWERRDYAQKEFTDLKGGVERQGHDSVPDIGVGEVHPREIYGTQLARRINKSTIGGA